MDYNRLKSYAQMNGIKLISLANECGMTLTGFKISFENGSFSIKNLCMICELLKTSPNDLLGFVPTDCKIINSQNGGIGNSQTNINSSIAALERQLEEKDNQIKTLLEIIKSK